MYLVLNILLNFFFNFIPWHLIFISNLVLIFFVIFIFFLFFFLIEIVFQFHPSWFDFIVFSYPYSFQIYIFFILFLIFFFNFISNYFDWLRIWHYYFFRFIFYVVIWPYDIIILKDQNMIITRIPLKYLILSIQVSIVKMVIINLDLEEKKN
jgi:hypothetical protein